MFEFQIFKGCSTFYLFTENAYVSIIAIKYYQLISREVSRHIGKNNRNTNIFFVNFLKVFLECYEKEACILQGP